MEDHRDLENDDDDNDQFDEDMDALRRACMISGTNPDDLSTSTAAEECESDEVKPGDDDKEEDDDYDIKLFQSIQSRFSTPSDPLLPQPLRFLPPPGGFSDDDGAEDDDDFETLRAIQKRFASYGNGALKNSPPENALEKKEQVDALPVSLENEASNDLCFRRFDACEEFSDTEYGRIAHQSGDNLMDQPSALIQWNPTYSSEASTSQQHYSSFPKAGRVFMDAIKKNRSYQKFLRSKLIQIEAKIEENKKLKERVKILKDFQVICKKRTGRALSQKKDARVQLISVKKACSSKDLKVQDRKIPAMFFGPQENSHAANYRMALSKFPLSLHRKKWSELETKNLEKGIRQQFQEMVLQNMVDRLSDAGDSRGLGNLDNLLASVKNLNITPENIREFLPKVKWDQVASLYVVGRSASECETRWLNFEDSLINQGSWTAQEDKKLLFIAQNKGINNWFDISVSLGTNRTPFQCLARYQRSLNVSILKSEWTEEDDAKLRSAVELYGECNWQAVASCLDGWTGTQCSNRWKKTLHPAREKVGRWTEDEDKRLIVAQKLFGTRNWKKIAQFVPGRTEVQCRERWVNSLDPSLNWDKWTLEEDLNLRKAIEEHGYCWAKVAAALPRRTDNMCRRRWKRLLPHEVPLLQAARRMQKAVFICNFVDRESERPTIGPIDFTPLPKITATEDINHSKEQSKKSRRRVVTRKKKTPLCETAKGRRVKKSTENTQTGSDNAPDIANHGELDALKSLETTTDRVPENGMASLEEQNGSSSLLQTQWVSEIDEVMPGFGGKSKKRPRKPSCKKELAERKEKSKEMEGLELQIESLNVASNGDHRKGSLHGNNTSLPKKRSVSSKRKDGGKTQATNSDEPLNVIATEDINHSKEQSKKSRRRVVTRKKNTPLCETAKGRRVKKSTENTQTGSDNAPDIANHGELALKSLETTTDRVPENGMASIEEQNGSSSLVQTQWVSENDEVMPGLGGKGKKRPRKPSCKKELAERKEKSKEMEGLELQIESLFVASNGDHRKGSLHGNGNSLPKKRSVSSKRKDDGKTQATNSDEPLNVIASNGDSNTGSLLESSTPLAKKTKVSSKWKDGWKTHATNSEEQLNVIASNGNRNTLSLQESRTLLAEKRRVSSKREDGGKTHATNSESLNVSLAYGKLLLSKYTSSVDLIIPPGTNNEEIHSVVGNDGSVEKKSSGLKQYSRRKKNTKSINVVPATSAKNGENSTLNSLACLLSSTSEKIKPLARVCDTMKETGSIDKAVGVPKASLVPEEPEKRSLNPEIILRACQTSILIRGSHLLSKT